MTEHEWENKDDGVQERVWVCRKCGTATNNAFLASLPRECPASGDVVDTFIFSALKETGLEKDPFLVLPEHRHSHLRRIMLWMLEQRWIALTEKKPESDVYLVYHPAGEFQGRHYAECVDIAFYDADEDVFRGGYHGPFKATHWKKKPKGPVKP